LKSDIFENSIWFTAVQWVGGYIGSCLALWTVGAGLRKLVPGLSFLLKVLADVARYLGDPDYRERVQQEVGKEVAKLVESGAEQVFIFAHSLGTVIAVDYLRATLPSHFRVIKLITCGSPLRRLFWRFFASDYSEPAETFRLLSRSLSDQDVEFDWFNVYRRKDPIGGSLELPGGHEEPVSRENETIWNAHLGYRNDSNAQEAVIRLLSNRQKPLAVL
jgi:pimeloyl-ACP methyl ester carboxylesterase